MRKTVLLAVILALGLRSVSPAGDHIWTKKADMPTPRWFHSSAVVNGKIYIIGGEPSEPIPNSTVFSIVEEYNPVTNTWTRKADMPTARGRLAPSCPVVDGKIYVVGGSGYGADWYSPTVEEYDPSTDTWTRKADMPTGRFSLATCAVGGKIYAFGGLTSDILLGSNIVEEYDSTTDTWTRKANIPTVLWALCANVVNGKIYVLGGRPGVYAIANVQEYDPTTDTWTRKADMPVGTSHMASVVLDDRIIVIGGWFYSETPPYTTLQMYDPETDIWTKEADVPFLRAVFSADVVNSRIYAIGGTDRPHPCPATSTVYEFGPLFDFNWDGTVDSKDMCILIDNWHTDYSLCDIAPLPLGDGIVDVQDLTVLAEHLFEEVSPVSLIGHWKLDEDAGDIAHDSTGDNHGILSGNPIWQTGGGQIGGALQFDGADDYVIIGHVVDPADGPFSIVAWIKGGVPGQVVVAHEALSDWLMLDAEGKLMTHIKCGGRSAGLPLSSEAIMTDGDWHRVGLVWDGLSRMLIVDDVVVAEDAQTGLLNSDQGLHIGTGNAMAPGTFFSGLIDDVRIYNRAVKP
jgi:N-acetylneuraminic acid mutarotase